MLKFWGFEFFPIPGDPRKMYSLDVEQMSPEDIQEYFRFFLDLWAHAEDFGFDGLFLSEHHFGSGYSPSPNLLLPLIAQRTKTMRLGVMGMVVPYHNAWRIVEEIGMLDILTDGRLEVGTSAGIPAEFAKIGMAPEVARERYDEAMQIIDAGLKQPIITHKGKYWDFENLLLVPRPIQNPHPPLWTTVISVESARKAARRGSKIATGFIPNDKVREVFDAYNEEASKYGNPTGPGQLGLRRQIIIDQSEAASAERSSNFSQAFREMLESVDKRVKAKGAEAFDTPEKGTHGYTLGDDDFIHGTPAQVAEQIRDQQEQTGFGHFQIVFAGHENLRQLATAWELFGTEVIPAFRKA